VDAAGFLEMRRSSGARIAASKYSLSLGATRTCATVVPSVVPPRAARPAPRTRRFSVGAKLPRYSPLRSPVHCRGTSMDDALWPGDVRVDAGIVHFEKAGSDTRR
jgi:hypothetical protein